MNRFFAPGGEFSLIEALFDPSHFSRDGRGLGDDAYLLETGGETWAVSADASVEGLHFRLDWTRPEAALEKALLSNLSDINAMGGRTALAFLTLGALKSWDAAQIARLKETLAGLEARYGFRVAGGDTVRKESECLFAFTVMGKVAGRPLLRSNVRPGHRLYLSGPLGRSAAGLALHGMGIRPGGDPAYDRFLAAHDRPEPPLDLGPALAALPGPVAAIDLSDGLSSELAHLSRRSGCRLTVEWGKLPYDEALERLPGGERWRDWVLHGGEEYQLLFAGDFGPGDIARLPAHAGIREIGSARAGEGVGIVDVTGAERELEAAGWSH
jgi:thiamine-monophosphate kinase